MGCLCGSENRDEVDRKVLDDYLKAGDEDLKKIWTQFNKNEDDVLDRAEFDRLLFTALQIFCKERDPDIPAPTREAMEPFIEKLRNELAPRIDSDGDGVISFEEFEKFGDYMKKEYEKLQKEKEVQQA